MRLNLKAMLLGAAVLLVSAIAVKAPLIGKLRRPLTP